MRISRLAETPEHTDVVAHWLWKEWGEESGVSLEEIRVRLLEPIDCPPTLLAMIDGEPAGVIGFRRFLRENQTERSLFIDVVYVSAPLRGRGIGSALLEDALVSARPYASELFVYTARREWYERRGWRLVDSEMPGVSVVLKYLLALPT